MLKKLQELTDKQPYELFDYIMGVSTGGLLAVMLGVFRVPLDECIDLYKDFSKEMFTTSRLEGARKLVTSYAYYDTQMWEKILQYVHIITIFNLIRKLFLMRKPCV